MQGEKYMVTSVLKVTTFEVCEIATGLISPNLVTYLVAHKALCFITQSKQKSCWINKFSLTSSLHYLI